MERPPPRRRASRAATLLAAALVLGGCAAPPRPLEAAASTPGTTFDHAAWTAILARSMEDGFVDYPALCRDPALAALRRDARALDLTAASPSERLSALMNGYNLLALDAVLAGGDPSTLLGRYRFFLRRRHAFAGEAITLWDLEHERIRPLGEARIHFAIVCASASCPKLRSRAYSPDPGELDLQLDAAARAFVNDPARNHFDLDAGEAVVSAIFDWYREDFETEERTLADYIAQYVDSPEVADVLRDGRLELRFAPYDWGSNGRALRCD